MIRVDTEACIVSVLEDLGVRWTTTERQSDLDAAAAGMDVVWLHGEDGSEIYGVFCTDMIRLHYYGATRAKARALAARVSDRLTSGPVWTPLGLLDNVDTLEGPTSEPQRDIRFHELTEKLAVETRAS